MLGDWGSHLNFDLLIILSEDVSGENVESLISSIFLSGFDDCFGNNPRFVVSNLELSNGLFDNVLWAVVVVDEEGTKKGDESGDHEKKDYILSNEEIQIKKGNF